MSSYNTHAYPPENTARYEILPDNIWEEYVVLFYTATL